MWSHLLSNGDMKLVRDGENLRFKTVENYCPPPLQLQTFEGIPCVFFPSIRNVFVMHSFWESAQAEIGSKSVDIFLNDFDTEIMEIEVNRRDKVLNPAQIKYLLLSNKSLSISRTVYLSTTLLMFKRLICLSYPLKILENLILFSKNI